MYTQGLFIVHNFFPLFRHCEEDIVRRGNLMPFGDSHAALGMTSLFPSLRGGHRPTWQSHAVSGGDSHAALGMTLLCVRHCEEDIVRRGNLTRHWWRFPQSLRSFGMTMWWEIPTLVTLARNDGVASVIARRTLSDAAISCATGGDSHASLGMTVWVRRFPRSLSFARNDGVVGNYHSLFAPSE